jgi:aldehyde:ferredoxin oxidoreductase
MPYGYTGKILRIDLNSKKVTIDTNDEVWYRTYWGGAAMAAWYMLKEMEAGIDPLGPDNMLLFMNSPIVGAPLPGLSRMVVCAKSPLTGGFGESQAGGFWAPELKKAGWDGLIITGKADSPMYLMIKDDQIEFKDAGHLWGLETAEAQTKIREENGDDRIRVAQIGPSGEKMVRFSSIVNDLNHVAGRTGLGAVMGSKNLRAIAVRGTQDIQIKDPEVVKEKAKWFAQNFMDNPQGRDLHLIGTSVFVAPQNELGILPTKNFCDGSFEGADSISGETMTETILKKREGCYACPVRCKRVVAIEEGPYKVDPTYGGPEYETLGALGCYLQISDLAAVAKGAEMCNKYGLDTISTGGVLAFAMECYEKGILTKEDTDGIEMTWGNGAALVEMIEKINKREGFGDILAEGSMRAAKKIGKGAEKYAIHVKGQEVPAHEPRGKGMLGITYSVSELGAEHTRVEHDTDFDFTAPEIWLEQAKSLGLLRRLPTETIDEDKVRMYYYLQHHFSMLDVLGCCLFTFAPVRTFTMADLVDMTSAITGWETSLWELMKAGERRWNMARAFNIREGFTKDDDWLPERLFEPLQTGALKGKGIIKSELREAIDLYYQMCNWTEDAVPTKAKLVELDLKWISDKMGEYVINGKKLRESGNIPHL